MTDFHTDDIISVDGITGGLFGDNQRVNFQIGRGVRPLTRQGHGLFSVIDDHEHCHCESPGKSMTVGTGMMVWTAEETVDSLIRLHQHALPTETRERLLKEQEGWEL